MSINRKSLIQLAIFLLIASVLIYWQYTAMDEAQLASIKQSIANAKWHYLIYGILISLVAHWLRAERWRMFFVPLELRTTTKNSLLALLIGYLANILVPRAGEILRCTTLSKYDNVPMDKSLGTVISERLFDTVTLLFVFILVLLIEYQRLADYGFSLLEKIFYDEAGHFHTTKIIVGIAILIIGIIAAIFIIRKIKNTKIGKIIISLLDGLKSILFIKNKLLFIIYTILIWFSYFLATYVVFLSMNGTEHLSFAAAMAVTAFGSIAIILTPGGIGAYPPIAAGILSFYAISYPIGIAVGWLSWFFQTIIVVILGIIAIILLPLVNTKKKNPLYDERKIGTNTE